jgi:hypothetical protein
MQRLLLTQGYGTFRGRGNIDAAASKAIEEKALADKIAIIQAEQSAREANLQTIANGLNGFNKFLQRLVKKVRL